MHACGSALEESRNPHGLLPSPQQHPSKKIGQAAHLADWGTLGLAGVESVKQWKERFSSGVRVRRERKGIYEG